MEATPINVQTVDFNLLRQLVNAVDRAQHELVSVTGLIVADAAFPEDTFTLDFTETIMELNSISDRFSDIRLPVTPRKRNRSRSRMPVLSRGTIQKVADELGVTRQAIYQRFYAGDNDILRRAIEVERNLAEERRKLAQELSEITEG